jgi:hypothetical protein
MRAGGFACGGATARAAPTVAHRSRGLSCTPPRTPEELPVLWWSSSTPQWSFPSGGALLRPAELTRERTRPPPIPLRNRQTLSRQSHERSRRGQGRRDRVAGEGRVEHVHELPEPWLCPLPPGLPRVPEVAELPCAPTLAPELRPPPGSHPPPAAGASKELTMGEETCDGTESRSK